MYTHKKFLYTYINFVSRKKTKKNGRKKPKKYRKDTKKTEKNPTRGAASAALLIRADVGELAISGIFASN